MVSVTGHPLWSCHLFLRTHNNELRFDRGVFELSFRQIAAGSIPYWNLELWPPFQVTIWDRIQNYVQKRHPLA